MRPEGVMQLQRQAIAANAGRMTPGAITHEPRKDCPALDGSEIHVWWADLDLHRPCVQTLASVLSPDEVERADRFRFQADRERFIVGRALLRTLVGRYLDVPAGDLRFDYNSHGKPSLASEGLDTAVRFNLSHTQSLAVFAITRGREVGVDLEMVREDFEWEPVARQVLSHAEIAFISAFPPRDQTRMFFVFWTRKEALAKALGRGLTLPLKRLDLIGESANAGIIVNVDGIAHDERVWSVQDLETTSDLTAAIAVAGSPAVIRSRQCAYY